MEKFISWGAGTDEGLGKGADSASSPKLCEKTNEEQDKMIDNKYGSYF